MTFHFIATTSYMEQQLCQYLVFSRGKPEEKSSIMRNMIFRTQTYQASVSGINFNRITVELEQISASEYLKLGGEYNPVDILRTKFEKPKTKFFTIVNNDFSEVEDFIIDNPEYFYRDLKETSTGLIVVLEKGD